MPAIFPKRLNPPWPKSAYPDTPAVRTSAEMATVLRHPSLLRQPGFPRDAACALRIAGNRSAGACFSASVSIAGVALLSASISDWYGTSCCETGALSCAAADSLPEAGGLCPDG
jgi:hypothetical protein